MFRKSILWKAVLGLCAAFLSGGLFLYWMVDRQEEASRTDQIVRDLNVLQANSQVYIRHLLILDGQNNDESSYREVAQEMVQELYLINGYYAAAYSNEGELLYTMWEDRFENREDEDLRRAMEGRASFTMFYPAQDQMAVTFSMPVVVVDETVGILRFWVDYSTLYRQGQETADMVLKSCIAVFCMIFLVILVLLIGILRPVRRLSSISRQVTGSLRDEKIEEDILEELDEWSRADEVGQLAGNMETMLSLLNEQFAGMKEDKARILELLKSRQDFYNNVTHELKTPLTVIQGYSSLLETAGEDEEMREKAVMHIRNESSRLYQMVLQLLDLAKRQQSGERVSLCLNETIHSVADAMELRMERYGMTLEWNLEPGLWILGEEERIRQLFVNVFDNAIKYGNDSQPIRVSGTRKDGKISIYVSNAGFLAERDRERIFDPFYRVSKEASREMGSAGLGLSLCRQLMEEQGGTIQADCQKNTVTFTLTFGEGEIPSDREETAHE